MKKMRNRVRLLTALVLLSSCIGCDQATKSVATRQLKGEPTKSFMGDTVRLEFALNPGGFLSLGSQLPKNLRTTIFIAMNACLMLGVGIFIYWKRNISMNLYVALLFVLAGGVGNLIDRVTNHGLVTDFMNLASVKFGQVSSMSPMLRSLLERLPLA